MQKENLIHCEDCLAYYTKGYNHVCPPWLKALVAKKKKEQAADGLQPVVDHP